MDLAKDAEKQFLRLGKDHPNLQERIGQKFDQLERSGPFIHGAKQLKGRDAYRIRIGSYRILYTILEPEPQNVRVILITDVSKRDERTYG